MKKANRAVAQEAKKKDRQFKQQMRRARAIRKYGDEDWKKDWQKFSEQLAEIGLTIKDVAGDGNCCFRALADQTEGDPTRHDNYRQRVCDFIERHEEDFAPFVEDDRTLAQHVAEMRRNATWGGHMELQAASRLLGVNIVIHQLAQPRWEIVNHFGNARSPARSIHLSYHDGDHYASVRNANEPTDRTGPPTPIVLPPGPGSSSSASGGSSNSGSGETTAWQEDLVMRSTCASNVYFVRSVLLEVGGDTDAAVEYIIALSHDGELDESFQQEFAYEHGIFPEGGFEPMAQDDFDPALLQFTTDEDEELAMQLAFTSSPPSSSSTYASASHSSSSSSPSKRTSSPPKHSHKQAETTKTKHKKKEEPATSSAPHPKLERFYQHTHLTNKQRNAMRRMEKEKPPTPAPQPAPVASDDTRNGGSSEPAADLGSLRI